MYIYNVFVCMCIYIYIYTHTKVFAAAERRACRDPAPACGGAQSSWAAGGYIYIYIERERDIICLYIYSSIYVERGGLYR